MDIFVGALFGQLFLTLGNVGSKKCLRLRQDVRAVRVRLRARREIQQVTDSRLDRLLYASKSSRITSQGRQFLLPAFRVPKYSRRLSYILVGRVNQGLRFLSELRWCWIDVRRRRAFVRVVMRRPVGCMSRRRRGRQRSW